MSPVAAWTRVPKVCREVWKEIVFFRPTFLAIRLMAASTLALAGRWKTFMSLPCSGNHSIAFEQIGTALSAWVFFWAITSLAESPSLMMSPHRSALMSLIRRPVRQAKPKALCASATPGLVSTDDMNSFSSSGVRNCLLLCLQAEKVSHLSII